MTMNQINAELTAEKHVNLKLLKADILITSHLTHCRSKYSDCQLCT